MPFSLIIAGERLHSFQETLYLLIRPALAFEQATKRRVLSAAVPWNRNSPLISDVCVF
jgi:hypothetical protein